MRVHVDESRSDDPACRVDGVAGGLVDFALGTDCGGSVRLPASYCGILGMRASLGRIPVDGIVPFSASFDVVGWFTREAELLERVGRVLLADEGPAPEPGTQVTAEGKDAGVLRSSVDGLGLALLRLDRLEAPLLAGEARLTPKKPDWLAI